MSLEKENKKRKKKSMWSVGNSPKTQWLKKSKVKGWEKYIACKCEVQKIKYECQHCNKTLNLRFKKNEMCLKVLLYCNKEF